MSFYDAADRIFTLDEGDGPVGNPGAPYRDTAGNWTIGRGHFIGSSLIQLRLSPAVIEVMFREDLDLAVSHARTHLGSAFYQNLPPARQLALVTMWFTLGEKFLQFTPTFIAIKAGNWDEVADRILASKWAKDVDPHQRLGEGRDDRIAYMFRFGKFHPDYGIEDLI